MTRFRVILLAIILLAFTLRVWDLPSLPPGLWYDEAYNGMDALWMGQTGHYQLFLPGNNGREPMWHYVLLGALSLLGKSTFTVRWVGSMAGFLTVPLMYPFAGSLLAPFAPDRRGRRWLALAATGLLAVSWWHLLNSRGGFRPVLLPPLLMLSLYFWMAAVRAGERRSASILNFILAGFFLGLSQYTYLPARAAPLIFGGAVNLWTLLAVVARKKVSPRPVGRLWFGLLLTALAAMLIFLPLGLFFLTNPEASSARTGDVAFVPAGFGEALSHLADGISLFLGAGHELYRHHLPGRAMLGWLEIPFFWIGLVFLLHPDRLRRPEAQLILIGLGVMWLPALLASPPVHALRPIGLLPFYYLIVAVGLYYGLQLAVSLLRRGSQPSPLKNQLFPVLAGGLIVLNGCLNIYDYFWRWGSHPEVYQEYNGPLVDLTQELIELSQTRDVIIPFHLYVHPTTRFLLWNAFPESYDSPPPALNRPVEMVLAPNTFRLLYVGNIPESPAMVLLARDEGGRGAAYVSRPPRAGEQVALNEQLASAGLRARPFIDRLGREVAGFISWPARDEALAPVADLFEVSPQRSTHLNWGDLIRLVGYEVTPQPVQPGRPVTLNLYWHSLTETTFDYRLFLQLLAGNGQPVNQWEVKGINEDMYRWRPDGILPSQHTLWLGPDTPPGPYLIRLGFFDPRTGQRLPLQINQQTSSQSQAIDQTQLGLFYVSPDGSDPRQPATPLSAIFADAIDLIGVTLPDIHNSPFTTHSSPFPVTFHWQARQPTDRPYTVFLQLLNEQGEFVSGWDRQPFNGLYPTDRWSPGEIIADTFLLPLPDEGLPPGDYRLISGFYDVESGQRLPTAHGSDFVELGQFEVENP